MTQAWVPKVIVVPSSSLTVLSNNQSLASSFSSQNISQILSSIILPPFISCRIWGENQDYFNHPLKFIPFLRLIFIRSILHCVLSTYNTLLALYCSQINFFLLSMCVFCLLSHPCLISKPPAVLETWMIEDVSKHYRYFCTWESLLNLFN